MSGEDVMEYWAVLYLVLFTILLALNRIRAFLWSSCEGLKSE
jgi:hypothetical protein